MATKITSRVIAPGAVTAEALAPGVGAGPVIANVQIANSSYVALDDTAVALDGGYILINGENFGENVQVIIANTNATSVTYISSSLVRAQVPAKSAGSYIMYLVNTDTGATAIRVNAVTYSGTPTWSTGSTLTEGAVDEAISIQLDATSDTSVTYQLQTGSTLPSGLTLAANGLLSGTVTGIQEDTLYNFTIEAVDAENQESPRAFSITITAGDANINSVVLALNADSNTFITDASTNSFAITPNGDTRPSAFSPYNTSWSNFFDGTGDYLSLTGTSAIQFGSEDFTIEGWVHTSITNAGTIYGDRNGANFTGIVIAAWNSKVALLMSNGSSWNINTYSSTTGSSITLNAWNHVAICRSGTTIYVFINGVQSYTASFTGSLAQSSTARIGAEAGDTAAFTGYVSNFRMVKGTALYTSSFTPSTTPLTAISGTGLLTCQSNRLIDNSTNNFTITRNGDVKVTSFGPFTETDTTTGSGYFDGSGDFLTTASNAAFAFGTGNFTIEAWVFPLTQVNTYNGIIGTYNTTDGVFLEIVNNNWYVYVNNNHFDTGVSVSYNTWNHVAVVRNSTTLRVYVNGTSVYSTNNSQNFSTITSAKIAEIDGTGSYEFTGYISDARIVKGTAVYTSAFTPPAAPLTAISGTSLLTLQNRISYNNSQPVDESGVKNIITRAGNASVGSYTPHTPAGWSAYFDGTGDFLTIPDNAVFDFGSGAFIIEGWINLSLNNNACIIDTRSGSTAPFPGYLVSSRSDGTIQVLTENSTVLTGTIVMPLNTWNHFTVVRNSSSNLSLFINGVRDVTATVSTVFNSTTNPIIGAKSLSGSTLVPITGYLSNFRIIKGESVYNPTQSTLTVPNAPLEPIANTSLLTLRGPSFTDDGPNRFAITRNGDTRITPFSPFKTHTIVPDSYSVYFDGTGDYLGTTTNNTALTFGTGDFTIEGWVFSNNVTSDLGICQLSDTSGGLKNITSGVISVTTRNGVMRIVSAGTAKEGGISVAIRNWFHFAFVRVSGVTNLYVNGVKDSTFGDKNDSTNYNTIYAAIGGYETTSLLYNGYISNFRIIKGTALYTSNFTPSTTPLTNIANTSLLTCQSSTVIDNSNNAFAITVNGNAQPTKYNPFGETVTTGVQYSPASHGGSMYFDGTGDYLNCNMTSKDVLGTANFTIDFWVYLNSRTAGSQFLNPGTQQWVLGLNNSLQFEFYAAGATRITSSTAAEINAWYHICLNRTAGYTTLYINGVATGTSYADTNNYSDLSNNGYIIGRRVEAAGSLGSTYINGYMSNFRIVRGTAVYTSAFVPPAAPPSPVAGTTLLLNGTNAAVSDGLGRSVLETIGTAKQVSDTKKFGTGSMYIPAITAGFKTDGVNLPGDFTIEFWVLSPITGGENFLIVQGINATNGFLINATRNAIRWRSNGTADIQYVFPTNNTNWYHVAIVRNGSASNNVKVYYDGNSVVSGTYTNQILASAGSLHIGPSNLLSASFSGYGYIDDFRITKGVARYTSNFTPPTSSFKLK